VDDLADAEEREARSLDRDHSHVMVSLEAPEQRGSQCGEANCKDKHAYDPEEGGQLPWANFHIPGRASDYPLVARRRSGLGSRNFHLLLTAI
jgi:hypothetical protein